jgi:prophage DNA circulation protein
LQFYETGDNRFPKDVDDKQSLLETAADTASGKNKSLFDKVFSIAKAPGFVVNSARNSVFAATVAFQNATKDVVATAEGIANLAYDIRNLKAEVNDLLQAPDLLSQRLLDSLALLEDAIVTPRGRLQAYAGLIGFVAGNTTSDVTPTRTREKTNDDTFNGFIQKAAIILAVKASGETEFESTEEAVTTRDTLRAAIENQIQTTNDDDVFQAFEDLQAQLVRVVPDVDSDLPNVQEVSLENSTNSLVLAYDLFGNPDSEADLITRNKIKNPAFIQGGQTLEVIDERARS